MILRLSSNAQRAVVVAASFAAALALSYFGIRNALAAHYVGLQTGQSFERAVQLEPTDPQNWYLLGRYWQYNLEDPDAARAIQSYLTALSLNPASWEIWLDLATVYETEGTPAAARDAFLRAKKIYPLSAEVSWRYGNFLLRQGERDPAAVEMRLAVAADPKRGAEAFSRALRAGFDIETILDRVLPPVSDAYLDVIRDQTADRHTDNARFCGTADSNQMSRMAVFLGLFHRETAMRSPASILRRNTPPIVPCELSLTGSPTLISRKFATMFPLSPPPPIFSRRGSRPKRLPQTKAFVFNCTPSERWILLPSSPPKCTGL